MDCDLLVIGSGVAGLVAAITAQKLGRRPVIVEKAAVWGGTTATSGGVLWVPGNPLMTPQHASNDKATAAAYLAALVGPNPGPRAAARVGAFLEAAPEMIRMLGECGVPWQRNAEHPDYYQDVQGAAIGRSLECVVADGRRLGARFATMRGAELRLPAFPSSLSSRLSRAWIGLDPFSTALRVKLANAIAALRGQAPLGLGRGLVSWLMFVADRLGIPLFLGTELKALVMKNGMVTGASLRDAEGAFEVQAEHGVLLACGGFARNPEIRRAHQPVDGAHSGAVPEDQGDGLMAALACGAMTEQMDSAWWMPSVADHTGRPGITLTERAMPGSIIVDASGRRYMNEAQSYMAAGQQMVAHGAANEPHWLLADDRFMRRYIHRAFRDAATRRRLVEAGALFRASTLAELARTCGLPEDVMAASVARFNQFARVGVDADYGRGRSAYDRYWANPQHRPNPSLGALEKPPFWAARIVPGDLGVNGGLATDDHGRVLGRDAAPIPGLFAAGNVTSSPFARAYPGAGATLSAAATFAFLAARTAAATTVAGIAERCPSRRRCAVPTAINPREV